MADLSWGFNLPQYGNPVQALENRNLRNERKQERDAEIARQQKKDDENDIWKRTKLVEDETNPEKVATGDITADQYLGGQTKQVMNSILSDPNFKNLPPNELYGMIQSKWLPVVQGANAMKDRLAQSDAIAVAHAQKDPNINVNLLKQDMRKAALGSVLKPDANGAIQFKPDDIYDPMATANNLMNGDNAGNYLISGKPMIDYIRNYKGDKFKFTKSLPDKSVVKYEGEVSPFKKLNVTPDANGSIPNNVNPELQINAEEYPSIQRQNPDGTTRPAKLINEDTFDQHFANQSAFKKLWLDHKRDTGVQPQTRQEENILQREFAAKLVEDNDKSGILYDRQHLPSNKVTVNTGNANKVPSIRDVYSDIDKQATEAKAEGKHYLTVNTLKGDAQQIVLDEARKATGDDQLGIADIKLIKRDNGDIEIHRSTASSTDPTKKETLTPEPATLIKIITPVGTNVKAQPSVKGKNKVIADDNKKKAKPATIAPPFSMK